MLPFYSSRLFNVARLFKSYINNGWKLNNPRFFQCLIGAFFVQSLEPFRGEFYYNSFFKLRNINPALLDIHLPAHLAG